MRLRLSDALSQVKNASQLQSEVVVAEVTGRALSPVMTVVCRGKLEFGPELHYGSCEKVSFPSHSSVSQFRRRSSRTITGVN